jgi:hypothetical protein
MTTSIECQVEQTVKPLQIINDHLYWTSGSTVKPLQINNDHLYWTSSSTGKPLQIINDHLYWMSGSTVKPVQIINDHLYWMSGSTVKPVQIIIRKLWQRCWAILFLSPFLCPMILLNLLHNVFISQGRFSQQIDIFLFTNNLIKLMKKFQQNYSSLQ